MGEIQVHGWGGQTSRTRLTEKEPLAVVAPAPWHSQSFFKPTQECRVSFWRPNACSKNIPTKPRRLLPIRSGSPAAGGRKPFSLPTFKPSGAMGTNFSHSLVLTGGCLKNDNKPVKQRSQERVIPKTEVQRPWGTAEARARAAEQGDQ